MSRCWYDELDRKICINCVHHRMGVYAYDNYPDEAEEAGLEPDDMYCGNYYADYYLHIVCNDDTCSRCETEI